MEFVSPLSTVSILAVKCTIIQCLLPAHKSNCTRNNTFEQILDNHSESITIGNHTC